MNDAESRSRQRPDWDEYFMDIARKVATRSTCLRRRVGAVLVKDKRILTTGYNGPPAGLEHCEECLRDKMDVPSGQRMELSRAIHAEQNTLVQAARHGINVYGATLYCTTEPCFTCTKMLINAGIKKIVFLEEYPDPLSREMLQEAGVESIQFDEEK